MSENGNMEVKPKNLVQKLCDVMAAVGYLQKKGKNEKQEYNYIREADVVAMMRDEFAKRNVFIFPSLLSHERAKLSRIEYDKVKESYVTDIVMRWTLVDGDSGEERVCDIPGCSASPGDKGVYVAMTGSEKYLLMKSFLLPTGDDPEDDANEEKGSLEGAQDVARRGLQKKLDSTDPKIRQIAKEGLEAINGKANGVTKAQIPTGGLNLPPVPPAAPPVPLESAGEGTEYIHGIIKRVLDKVTKDKRAFKEVGMLDQHDKALTLSSFDNFQLSDGRLWQYLTPSVVGLLGTFTVAVKEKGGKTYYNIINVELLGEHRWDNGVGVMQREAAEEPQVPF